MQDVFEPTANFGGDVFEPTANFGGEVFEPIDFDGDYSNFAVDPNLVIQGGTALVGLIGGASQNKASKDANKSPLQREIDTVCGTKQKFLFKGKRNTYNDCKNRVIAKSDKEKQTNVDLANKQFDMQRVSLQTANTDKEAERKEKSKRNLILGASIGGGVLILGTILFFVLRKK